VDDNQTVKITLAIVCSLLLVLGQAVRASAPAASSGHVEKNCGCGGKMSCCQTASVPQPPVTAAPVNSQNQLLVPVPAAVLLVLPVAGTVLFSLPPSPALPASSAPIFARNCIRLI
jgi:hypothetical protein